jgi:hypothetical protein
MLLKRGASSGGSITDDSDGVELLDVDELVKLSAKYASRQEELERMKQVYDRESTV